MVLFRSAMYPVGRLAYNFSFFHLLVAIRASGAEGRVTGPAGAGPNGMSRAGKLFFSTIARGCYSLYFPASD